MPFGVKANVRAPHRILRYGALRWIALTNPGWGGERIFVVGMSRGGRRVNTWVDARDMHNYRAAWFPVWDPGYGPIPFESRGDAQAWADDMNRRFAADPVRPHAATHG